VNEGRVATAALGAGFVAAAVTGRAELFVRPWFVPVLLAAGAVMLIAAWRAPRLSIRSAAILALPLAAGLFLSPGLAGRITAASNTAGEIPSRLGDTHNPLLGSGGGQVTLLDILLAEQQVGAVYLSGRGVTVDGVVQSGDRISRLVMVCCAADARPVTLDVVGRLPATGTWVQVRGRLAVRGVRLFLRAADARAIPTPSSPFL